MNAHKSSAELFERTMDQVGSVQVASQGLILELNSRLMFAQVESSLEHVDQLLVLRFSEARSAINIQEQCILSHVSKETNHVNHLIKFIFTALRCTYMPSKQNLGVISLEP